mmetsp:Transcript_90791/g.256406  ORF Transcript_90791/g.256406 Transcript_90791/m.256406 type:complete len:199 (-) Transcript_90791:102-698(-)
MTANIAPVKWAQRKDSIYLTISLPDVVDHKIELTEKKLLFSGKSGGQQYTLDLEFLKELTTDGSIWNVLPNAIHMKLLKKEQDEEFWPRLLLDKVKEKTNVKIDWDKYVDEDEADGNDFDASALDGGMDFGSMGGMGGMPGMGGMGGMGGMDFSKMAEMAGMGGMPGMGGENDEAFDGGEEDSDDDEGLPDLESAENP